MASISALSRKQQDEAYRFNRDCGRARLCLSRNETLVWMADGWTAPSAARFPIGHGSVLAVVANGEAELTVTGSAPLASITARAKPKAIRLIKGIHDHD